MESVFVSGRGRAHMKVNNTSGVVLMLSALIGPIGDAKLVLDGSK